MSQGDCSKYPERVRVPHDVLEGLEAVRATGRTNMGLWTTVERIARELGHDAAAEWVHEHRMEYWRGFLSGFCADPEEDCEARL